MVSVHDIPPKKLIEEIAAQLKQDLKLKAPEWTNFAKTGAHKERPPVEDDWWWIRQAALLRTLYKKKKIGVSKLRAKYGGKRRRGHKPSKFYKGSGSVIRKALQQLEEAELVKKTKEDGRELTNKGLYLLNQTAKKLKNESGRNKKEKTERVAKESKPTPDKSGGARKSPAGTTKEKPAKQVPDKGSDRKAGKSKTSAPSTG